MKLWVWNFLIANNPRTVIWIMWYSQIRWEQKWRAKKRESNEQVTCGTLLPQFSILTPQALHESIYTVPQFWIWYILWVWPMFSFISWMLHFCAWGDREFVVFSILGLAVGGELSTITVFLAIISNLTGRVPVYEGGWAKGLNDTEPWKQLLNTVLYGFMPLDCIRIDWVASPFRERTNLKFYFRSV